MGCAEKDPGSYGTLYNTQIIFGADGQILGKHCKLSPTAGERLIHSGGDGSCACLRTLRPEQPKNLSIVSCSSDAPLSSNPEKSRYSSLS